MSCIKEIKLVVVDRLIRKRVILFSAITNVCGLHAGELKTNYSVTLQQQLTQQFH